MVAKTPTLANNKFASSTTNKKKDRGLNGHANRKPPSPIEEDDENDDIHNISGISPIKSPTTKRRMTFEDRKANSLKIKQEKILRSRIDELESKLKRAESDAASWRSRVNSLKTQVQEKDRHIRDLELRLPKVLADISRNVGSKEALTRTNNKNVREVLRKNHQLKQKVNDLESQMVLKEGSLDKLKITKVDNIRLKAENSRVKAANTQLKAEVARMRSNAEENVLLRAENADLRAEIKRRVESETRLGAEKLKMAELTATIRQMNDKLQDEVRTLEIENSEKISVLVLENNYLYKEISQHYDELLRTEADLQNIENVVFKISSNFDARRASSCSCGSTSGTDKSKDWINSTWPPTKLKGPLLVTRESDINDNLQDFFGHTSYTDPFSGEVEEGEDVLCYSFSQDEYEEEDDDQCEFNDSQEKSIFISRVEDLDLKLDLGECWTAISVKKRTTFGSRKLWSPKRLSPKRYTPRRRCSPRQCSPLLNSPKQYSPKKYSPTQYSSRQYSQRQFCFKQYSPRQYARATNKFNFRKEIFLNKLNTTLSTPAKRM